MFRKPREPSTVKVVNSIQTDIVNGCIIDLARGAAVAAVPHSVSPALKKLLCRRTNQAMERGAIDCSARCRLLASRGSRLI
jgi:hypothetical protein